MKTALAAWWPIGPGIAVGLSLALAPSPAAAKKAEARPASILTEESRGMVSARVGVPIEIQLSSQPGTGFSWVPTSSASLVTALKPVQSKRVRPGGWQTQRFRFLAKRTGNYRVTFSYDQPWRGGTKGGRTKTFLIFVR
ncbi:MAG TPA: protease inhibitor I42 family protein [Sphingomicrobium sp.]|nr:protease inhibitor I42 family protein [Sphingomicrobium sp.]